MQIKKGDKVKVLAGKDGGKTGKVLQVFPSMNRMSVEGVNILIKHLRPRRKNEAGQRVEFPAPMNASNAMLVCPNCGKPTRVGHEYKAAAGGKKRKYRVCKKCQATIE
jgi:large subunit ribosomal protein L24